MRACVPEYEMPDLVIFLYFIVALLLRASERASESWEGRVFFMSSTMYGCLCVFACLFYLSIYVPCLLHYFAAALPRSRLG